MIKKHWIAILISIGILSFLLGFLGHWHWILDILSHFRFYYFWYFITLIPVAFFFKKKIWGGVGLAFAFMVGMNLMPFYLFPYVNTNTQHQISITAINLLSSNKEHQKVLDFIEKENTDLVLIQELNPTWFSVLEALNKNYPYHLSEPRNDNFGIGLWSKTPFDTIEIKRFTAFDIPFIHAQLGSNVKSPFHFIGAHPVPPLIKGFHARNQQFEELNQLVRTLKTPTIIMGDFNCTTYSPNFKRITNGTTLEDSRLGYGRQPSWSANLPLRIGIDHCLISENIVVHERKIGSNIGSDHFPVVVRLGVLD